MVRTLPPVGRKHLPHTVGDRPHPDLPYPSGGDQKNDLSTARRTDISQCPPRERSRQGTVRSQYSQDWSFDRSQRDEALYGALYELFANGDPTVTKMIKPQKQQSPVVSEPG